MNDRDDQWDDSTDEWDDASEEQVRDEVASIRDARQEAEQAADAHGLMSLT